MAVKFFEIIFHPILNENQGLDRSTAILIEHRLFSCIFHYGYVFLSNIVLGNMDEIHHFHETFLHPALVKCGHSLNEIGRVFLEYSDNFEIYSIYCRNSKKSEELRRILGRNAFLQSCQNKLNHALPLSAYLLKPIQRLTKYQLLLEQLVKYNKSGRFSKCCARF